MLTFTLKLVVQFLYFVFQMKEWIIHPFVCNEKDGLHRVYISQNSYLVLRSTPGPILRTITENSFKDSMVRNTGSTVLGTIDFSDKRKYIVRIRLAPL